MSFGNLSGMVYLGKFLLSSLNCFEILWRKISIFYNLLLLSIGIYMV